MSLPAERARNIARVLIEALHQVKADAVWPGWGFAAERPEFVDLCDRIGVEFIGPTGDMMRKLGDKITSKKLAAEAAPLAPLQVGTRTLDWSRTYLMGVVNVTPDSFSDGGKYFQKEEALARAKERMEQELGEERPIYSEGCEGDWVRLPIPDGPLTVAIDGGFVRAQGKQGHFEVVTGKSVLAFKRDDPED